MNMKRFLSYLLTVAAAACTWSCGGNADPDEPEKPVAPASISLSNASFNVAQAGETVSLDITSPSRPAVSGAPDWISVREGIYNSQTYVMTGVKLTVAANTTYETRTATLTVSAGSASATFTVSQDGRSKPAEPDNKNLSKSLVTASPSANAKALYDWLLGIYCKQTLSCAMADVAWNQDEADWIQKWTGKYTAVNTYDYIHLASSPANWIDYGDMAVADKWYNAGGIVSACWHWNVEKIGGGLTCTTSETNYTPTNVLKEGTKENLQAKADLEKIAGYLKQLQDRGIAVIWRPLHEAAGNTYTQWHTGAWFWWGRDGGDTFRELWKFVFNYFKDAGLNNLIWVWTCQATGADDDDSAFYPGDDYVDLIAADIYNVSDADAIADRFRFLAGKYPKKMVTLGECGNVPDMGKQWEAGAKWLYFMPWYDHDHSDTKDYQHTHATIDWWMKTFACEAVLTRDELPSDLFTK